MRASRRFIDHGTCLEEEEEEGSVKNYPYDWCI
jgi:hypothetical protein